MNERKFLIAGKSDKNSVWLHVVTDTDDKVGSVGVSVWKAKKLVTLEFPANWLNAHAWIIRLANKTIKTGNALRATRTTAYGQCLKAILKHDRILLAKSLNGFLQQQLANGNENLPEFVPYTLGQMYLQEYGTNKVYAFGVTSVKITTVWD